MRNQYYTPYNIITKKQTCQERTQSLPFREEGPPLGGGRVSNVNLSPQATAFHTPQPPHKKKVIILSAFSIGATLLDAMVLAVLSKEDTYGYQITKDIQAHFAVSESTLYPVLRRLQKNGSLTTYDQPFQGRNRRYYRITVSGRALLEQYRKEWCTYKQQVDFFLDETPSA